MPDKVVLDTKQGSAYDDAVAERYHFPSRYLRPLTATLGGWAVFRRPRDDGDMAYFGVGRIVEIVPDSERAGQHYALVGDYLPFPSPVPWRRDGRYAERALRQVTDFQSRSLPPRAVGAALRKR